MVEITRKKSRCSKCQTKHGEKKKAKPIIEYNQTTRHGGYDGRKELVMSTTHYEWWTVDVIETSGKVTWEIKCKSEEHAKKQIIARMKKQNKRAEDESLPGYLRCGKVLEVCWDTLTLDRVGYQRLS